MFAYKKTLRRWSDAALETPIYVIDSAGQHLLADPHQNYTYVCFQQPESTLPQKSRVSVTERASLERLVRERPEILTCQLCFKITGKYFVPHMDAIIRRVPHDADLVLQHAHTRRTENTECVGMTPRILVRVLRRVNKRTTLERAVAQEITEFPDLKRVRLQPIPILSEDRVARSDGSVLAYL